MSFVTRKKYAALAARILSQLPAFLIYHLCEKTVKGEGHESGQKVLR